MEFQAWAKIPRLFRDITITEKIDGTNACVIIEPNGCDDTHHVAIAHYILDQNGERWYQLGAQSRSRLITPDDDNYGFARWVRTNAETLVTDLGPGRHYGEWWGQGIQRKYGLNHRRFSLFNTSKWRDEEFQTPNLHVVPTLYEGPFDDWAIFNAALDLEKAGSAAAPGFMNPEGVCIYHHASRQVFKYTLDGDGHKG